MFQAWRPLLSFLAASLAAPVFSEVPSTVKLDEVIVRSSPLEQTLFESVHPVAILEGDGLTQKLKGTLGQTLAGEPGITSTSFGPGASRPVIRGLGGDRIRILENGIGSQDVSNISPDHGVSVDPIVAEKIEVVRGPAALLYGTSAVGGLVNIFDRRIPTELPVGPLEGRAEVRGGTNASERAGAFSLDAPIGNVALHFDASSRKADDYRIPGFARRDEFRKENDGSLSSESKGKVRYSHAQTTSVALGTSYIFDRGFLGMAGSLFNTDYGVPNGEEDISIDGRRPKLDFRGRVEDPFVGIESVDLKVGMSDYQHTEFEGQETGTIFKNKGFDGRVELKHKPIGHFEGLFGIQAQTTRFTADGEEAFQPPTATDIYSAFLFEMLPISNVLRLEAGMRIDGQATEANTFGQESRSRDFTTLSQSFGVVWNPVAEYALALSVARTERAPTGQELFANGPHVATAAYERGDDDLEVERSLGFDLTLRKESGRVTGSVGGFYNRFNNYIGLNPTGEIVDDLPVYVFQAQPVDFYGFEAQTAIHLLSEDPSLREAHDLAFRVQSDYVWAQDRDTHDALPRIPPLRVKVGLNYVRELFTASLDVMHVFAQQRTVDFETNTDAYTTLNLGLSQGLTVNNIPIEIFVRGENLTNEKVREHVSFLKDITPQPGINLISGVRVTF